MLGSSAANATPVNRVKAATAQAQKSAIRAFGRPLPPLMTASRSPRHLHRKQRREASTERYRPPELRVDGQSASACHGESPAGAVSRGADASRRHRDGAGLPSAGAHARPRPRSTMSGGNETPAGSPLEGLPAGVCATAPGFAPSLNSDAQPKALESHPQRGQRGGHGAIVCLLYTSDAADDLLCVDLGGRRIIKK